LYPEWNRLNYSEAVGLTTMEPTLDLYVKKPYSGKGEGMLNSLGENHGH